MMAFEMKYDRDGNPIKPAQEPVFEEVAPAPVEAVAENHAQELETVVENQTPEPEAQAAPEPQPEPVKEAPYKESWKILREKAEKAERRARELEEALQAQQQQRQQHQPQDQEDPELAPDDLVEAKYVNKKIKKLEQQLYQQQQQSYEAAIEAKLKIQYPDFDKIVNQETIAMFKTVEPELAATVNASPDLYAKAVSAYKMIKKLGIAVEDTFQEQKALVQKNAAKPKPMASVSPQQGDSPLSKANAFANGTLTDDLKKQLWKEMNEVRR